MSQVHEITGEDTPFWIIVAGGKRDFTIKWWDVRRWQAVVDHFRGRIQFVQVGEAGHHHPALSGVIDLRGKADLRQLVRLVYHAQGVLCPVTSLMHLAAAVPMKGARASSPQSRNGNGNHPSPQNRPCVVVAGGREPPHWEAYPHHQFIHTNGQLLCCDHGGCWKARTVPLGDGDEKDAPSQLCVDVVPSGQAADTQHSTFTTQPPPPLPRCMDMITAEEVILRIEGYFTGGAARYLTAAQAAGADGGGPPMEGCLSPEPAPQASGRVFRRTDRRPPPGAGGHGESAAPVSGAAFPRAGHRHLRRRCEVFSLRVGGGENVAASRLHAAHRAVASRRAGDDGGDAGDGGAARRAVYRWAGDAQTPPCTAARRLGDEGLRAHALPFRRGAAARCG